MRRNTSAVPLENYQVDEGMVGAHTEGPEDASEKPYCSSLSLAFLGQAAGGRAWNGLESCHKMLGRLTAKVAGQVHEVVASSKALVIQEVQEHLLGWSSKTESSKGPKSAGFLGLRMWASKWAPEATQKQQQPQEPSLARVVVGNVAQHHRCSLLRLIS